MPIYDYIELLIKIGPGVLTAIIGFLGGYQLHRVKARYDIRQKHFTDIKLKVLEPLKEFIRQHYIPVLEHKKDNLYIESQTIYEEASGLKPPITGLRYQIAIREPLISEESENIVDKIYQIPKSPYIDSHLLSDTKTRHFFALIKRFDAMKKDFDEYNNLCLAYAQKLRDEIASESRLSDWQDSILPQGEWINTNKLAIFIFERQLGINNFDHAQIESEGSHSILRVAATTLAKGDGDEIKHVGELIEDLIRKTNKSQEIIDKAKQLSKRTEQLKDEFEKLILTHKLPGTCPYCKI